METKFPILGLRFPVAPGNAPRFSKIANRKSQIANAFTLIELLTVITILGILAGLAVPALKELGKSNATVSAARQLLDDVGRARQLAISHRTTVYMIFVPPSFWSGQAFSAADQTSIANLYEKQYTGYTYVCLRSAGDQPGQHTVHYLAPWQSLPENTFIAVSKFGSRTTVNLIGGFAVQGFNSTNIIPFPSETSTTFPSLPYIAFNSQGQPTIDGQNPSYTAEYIPLAQGPVGYAVDQNKVPQAVAPQPLEIPPGNSTNSAFNLVHVDGLMGRAILEFQKLP